MHKKKYYTWEECINLKETKCLRILNHNGIARLKELIKDNNNLYSVYEYYD